MSLPAVNPGLGSDLQHGVTGSPPTYTSIAGIVSIDPNEAAADEADTTNLKSTTKSSRSVIVDLGTVGFKIQYNPTGTTHKLLTSLLLAKTEELWQILFADGPSTPLPFTGFVKKFKPTGLEVEGNLEAEVEIRVNSITYPT